MDHEIRVNNTSSGNTVITRHKTDLAHLSALSTWITVSHIRKLQVITVAPPLNPNH